MRFNNITIYTTDIVTMTEFYRVALNATVVEEHGGPERIELVLRGQSDAVLVLCQRKHTEVGALPNFCLEFQIEDAASTYERLISCGYTIEEKPKSTPWGFRWIFFKDPDGNEVVLGSSCPPTE